MSGEEKKFTGVAGTIMGTEDMMSPKVTASHLSVPRMQVFCSANNLAI